MIYDCFAFFNELDILELRLNTLDAVVDKFVIVEGTQTFQKKPKPLHYLENKARFEKFNHKIIHIVVDKFPGFFYKFRVPRPWDYDHYQKNQIKKALKNCDNNDFIIYSDVDEIPNPEQILAYRNEDRFVVFEQKHFYYYMNCVEVEPENEKQYLWWYGPVMVKYKNFSTIRKLRNHRHDGYNNPNTVIAQNGGWHFAYLGGIEKIIYKIESYAHTEHNKEEFKDPEKIKEIITSGKGLYGNDLKCVFVEIDHSFPEHLLNNKDKYSKYIYK